jgi:hypothetical protein
MRFIAVCLLPVLLSYSPHAQSASIHYHPNETHKKDLNQAYINERIAAMTDPDERLYQDGMIYRNGDTIRCQIAMSKQMDKKYDDHYLYIIARLPDDSLYVLTPRDISGYTVAGCTMRSHRSVASGDTSYFYIRLVERGLVTLYERPDIPSDREQVYYLGREGDSDLTYLAPERKSDHYVEEMYCGGKMLSKYSGVDDVQLRAALAEYLKDCESVHHKLDNSFYSVNDVQAIIRDYNRCRK